MKGVDVIFKDGSLTITVPLKVGVSPSLNTVIEAAKKVCNVRYSDAEWYELNQAISDLIDALQEFGVKFDNPRIQ